jgi:hypothetical protein
MIKNVTVYDAGFNLLKMIDGPAEIAHFSQHWTEKRELKGVVPFALSANHFKIDIDTDGRSTRWLYTPEGKARLLSKANVADYALTDVVVFNELLQIG